MKYFYTKYLILEEFLEDFHKMDLSEKERQHLSALVDSSLHHAILNEILSNLSEKDREIFLNLLKEDSSSEKLMEFLKDKVEGIEEKINKVSGELIKEMHEDIKKAKST